MNRLLLVLVISLTLTSLTHAKTVRIEVTDAYTNTACAKCEIAVKIDNSPIKKVRLNDQGRAVLKYKKNIAINATAGKENYIPAIRKLGPKSKNGILLEFMIYPNAEFEEQFLKENNCKIRTFEDIDIGDSVTRDLNEPGNREATFDGDMQSFLVNNISYPTEALERNETGKVFVEFIVEKDGRLTCPQILKKAGPLIDAETLRVIRAMPNWNPAMHQNEYVRARCRIPINYRLE